MGQMCKTDLEIINLELYEDKVWNLNDREQMQYRDEYINKTIAPGTYPLTLEQGKRPQSELQKDVIYNFNLLKKNLENIMSSPKDIELIANSINIDNRYNINKDWDNIKQKYVNMYGVNNPHLTNKDIIKFLNENIGYIKADSSAELLLKIEDMNKKINTLAANEEKRKLIKRLNILERDINDKKEELEMNHGEFIKARERIEELENYMNELLKDNQDKQYYIMMLENRITDILMDLEVTKKNLQELEHIRRTEGEFEHRAFEEYARTVRIELGNQERKIEDLKKDLQGQERENKELNQALNRAIEQHNKMLIEYDNLTSEVKELNKQNKELIEKMKVESKYEPIQEERAGALLILDAVRGNFTKRQIIYIMSTLDEETKKQIDDPNSKFFEFTEVELYNIISNNISENFSLNELKRFSSVCLSAIQNKEQIIKLTKEYLEKRKLHEIPEKKIDLSKEKKGSGMRHKNIVKFGSIGINKDKLYYDNVLSILDNKNNRICLMKNKKVTDDFVDLMSKTIEGQKINNKDINILNNDDKNLYYVILKMAKEHKNAGINIDNTESDLKKKFELLEGEIKAGNNNNKLFDDMKDILGKMIQLKLISQHSANSYIKDIKKNFV
jgi:hypothetical protein